MANYAVLSGDTVTNVVVANTAADAEFATNATCIEFTDANPAGIGMVYDSVTGTFSSPVAE